MTQNEAIRRVLSLAQSELCYHEKASNANLDSKSGNSGSGNWTKYARDLANLGNFYNGDKNGYAWCDVFIDWLFVKCFGAEVGRNMICQPTASAGAGCLYSAQYYKQAGRWVSQPQAGDQIFFSYSAGEYSHTGIVESVQNGTVTTIEGNSSDQVARRSYPLASGAIVGYGRPKWELAAKATGSPSVSTTEDAAASVTAGAQSITGVLRKGSTGENVRQLQLALQDLGYNIGSYGADGDFGGDTYAAVVKFQKDHGLEADGEVGPMTLAAVSKALNSTGASSPAATTGSQKQSMKTYFAIGDMVQFTGVKYYTGTAANTSKPCSPGRAVVVNVNRAAAHPYYLCKINGYGSTVHGWVDYSNVRAVVS